jgi:hypothetical protein
MEKEKQFAASCSKRFIPPRDLRRILADKASAEATVRSIPMPAWSAVPLSPGIERAREAIHYAFLSREILPAAMFSACR